MAKYSPPSDLDDATPTSTKGKLPTPRIGDVVRYYDVDGGKADGQVLVGKISLIQSIISASASSPSSSSSSSSSSSDDDDDGTNRWLVEIAEMEDVGDGYYAEYPYRKRPRPALRKLEYIAPLPASYVRSEDAYKVPLDGRGGGGGTGAPLPSHPGYDVAGYEGPAAAIVNEDVVRTDGEAYDRIKFALLGDAALAGLAGAALVGLSSGPEYAAIYAAGAAAGVGYLYLLGVKTDTLGVRPGERLGSSASNARFLLPVAVLGAVALWNAASSGDDGLGGAVASPGMFSTVSPGQFGSAMIGFLTYRVPLFARQLFPVLSESIVDIMPGSAAMAVRMVSDAKKREGASSESYPPPPSLYSSSSSSSSPRDDNLVTILLISGPEGTGKTTLVNRLLDEDVRFVRPTRVDRVSDGAKFERLESRGEFLEVDWSGRYGLSREGILGAAAAAAGGAGNHSGGAAGTATPSPSSGKKVVVVDADVSLARKLVDLSGARLVGVWIGLDDIDKFESLLRGKIASGKIDVPEGETEDAVLRAKVRQVVKDIEFGVVSG